MDQSLFSMLGYLNADYPFMKVAGFVQVILLRKKMVSLGS